MTHIKIKFSGMGGNFDENNNFIINILRKRFEVEISDKPDYLIFSVNSKDYLNYNCVRIFYTAENVVPDFNICDYAVGFHYIKFEDRYFRYPLYLVEDFNAYKGDDYAADLTRALRKHENADRSISEKTDFCSFVYSNADAVPCRQMMFEALSKYKGVNSGGRYLNNVGGPVDNKLEFQKKHKFVLAFENTATAGYTTEKLVHAFSAGAVPIYWGDPKVSDVFNSDSFINCNEFGLTSEGSPEVIAKIIERIKEIDQNDELYRKMLETPAFLDSYSVEDEKKKFEDFLLHIFDQPTESAFRRNRYLWGERYERKQKIGNKVYWQLRKLIPLRDGVKKVVKR